MANHNIYFQSAASDAYTQWTGAELQGVTAFGYNGTGGVNNMNAAYRFANIPISQGVTVNDAILRMYTQFQGSGVAKINTVGIKVGSCAPFNSNPFGTPTTSAATNQDQSMPGIGNYAEVNVTSQINEILGQAGWASGNAMGFIIKNNAGGGTNAWCEDDSLKAQLLIRLNAVGTLFPTPGTISAPTFPGSQSYGIKVSQPGQDVKTATEAQTYYTSKKRELRVSQEYVAPGTTTQVAHGLGYAPSVLGYYNNGGTCRIMNVASNVFSVEEYIASDGTNILYNLAGTAETGYLYIFIDPLT